MSVHTPSSTPQMIEHVPKNNILQTKVEFIQKYAEKKAGIQANFHDYHRFYFPAQTKKGTLSNHIRFQSIRIALVRSMLIVSGTVIDVGL